MLAIDGVSLKALLEGTGIALTDLTLFDLTINYDQYLHLIDNACCLAPDPSFALQLGEQLYINHDGILACRVMSCANAYQAMKLLTEYQSLLTHLFKLDFRIIGGDGVFTASSEYPLLNSLPFFIEYTFASVYSLGKFCTGLTSFELAYEFSYTRQMPSKRYANFFGKNIQFDCKTNRVVIPKAVLEAPFIFENKQAAKLNDLLCQDRVRQFDQEIALITQVKMLIRKSNLSEVSLENIAESLCMSPRTLRRHLRVHNISYKDLLEAERKTTVQKALNQNVPLKQVAEQLGYRDASSFSRAFKQWFGISPNLYKAK